MFRKPFKIKSNCQVKGSERKNIRANFLKSFRMSENDVDTLLLKKEVINSLKIVTATNETIQLYTVGKIPMAFDFEGRLYPTIYLLWKFPSLLYAFTIHPQVMTYIESGADLMLPGVVPVPSHTGQPKFGNLNANELACVNFTNNTAAVAVGTTAQSAFEMTTGRGKCLTILHYFGDKLCSLEGMPSCPLPNLGPPAWLRLGSYQDDFPELGANPVKVQQVEQSTPEEKPAETTPDVDSGEKDEEKDNNKEEAVLTPEEMDDLLNYCFFVAIKYSKNLTLPILTSNFYKLQMIPVCPPDKSLDLKKSSFKKLKPFLDAMCKEKIITVKEMKKGVESITEINTEHPKFAEFYAEPSARPKKSDENNALNPQTTITESYVITANVLPIFAANRLGKGDTVEMPEIRRQVTEYVKANNCLVEDNKRLIQPKEALVKICKTENKITWEELIEKVCASMKSTFKVSSGHEQVVNKGKVSPIILSISQRSGNKKVTLIDNLELFGIKMGEFAKECQHGVAASTSISRPPGKKCDQLLVQGNQILFIHSLLTEKYKIPQKYIRGLEHAPKKKR